jgi:carbon monoxide dehydrogenase subunit G
VKVKLGPIALVYAGSGSFVSKDDAAHAFVVEAKGRDKRGNGTAGATVTVSMAAGAGDSTDVSVETDLSITGKPAQFGRGVMQDVSDKLLGQFVACLEQRSASSLHGGADQDAAAVSESTGAAAATAPGPGAEPGRDTAGEAPASGSPAPVVADGPQPTGTGGPSPAAASGAEGSAAPGPQRVERAQGSGAADDALDLGATVLPVLLRAYWKQLAAALGVLVVLRAVLRRRA